MPSSYSFWDLHVAIQDSMGWADYHLHIFEMNNPITNKKVEIGIPSEDDDAFSRIVLPDHKENIRKYFNSDNNIARYEYDFGDSWIHTVKFEKIITAKIGEKYPKCIGGKMACPPEDCGGIYGYYRMLSIIKNPKHEEYNEMLEWLGGEFNPERFEANSIFFDDPQERFNLSNRN